LYPFRIDTDFRVGYAWSAELCRRLKARLSLFTTITPTSAEPVADVYHALAEAQAFYVKNFQLLQLRLKPVKSERNFLQGEFAPTFLDFAYQSTPHIVVLQSDLFPNEIMKGIINSGCRVIVLSSSEILKTPTTRKDRAELFITMLQHAAFYNIPTSFFKTIGQDTGLFNYIAALFKK
jgi:hypothetical protein